MSSLRSLDLVGAWIPYSLINKAATATVTVINPDAPPLVGKSNPVFLPITIPTAGLAFTEKNTTLAYPGALAVGDFNGDGKPDIAVLTYVGATVVILLGKGDGTFTAAPLTPTVGGNPNSIAVGDLNGDGKLDLVVSSYNTLSVLLGKGDGSFTAIAPPAVGSAPGGVFLVDLNRDGKLDLVLGNGTSPFVSVLLGHGNGTFSAPTSPVAPTGPVTVMDVNRDGKLDLLFAEGNAPGFAQTTISVALGLGNGQFTAGPPSPVVDNGISGGFLADLNGDGKLDYAATGGYPNHVYEFFLGDGHGTFNFTTSFEPSNNGSGPAVAADFNADGRLDLATFNDTDNGTVSVLLQVPAP